MNLVVKNISFSFKRGNTILNDISFSATSGKITCILGASGCGKSTLLRVIAELLPNRKDNIFSGEILMDSQSISSMKNEGKLSFMFQEPSLMPNLTVSENIALPLQILGGSNNGTFENIINTVGLSEATNKFPKDLSGGMKTRTALARSFITNPKLLLLDEPFSALDLGWKNTLYKELNALQAANNTCVVMVTHDIEEAVELGSRILVLSHSGAGIAEYTPNATNKETLRKEIKDVVLKDHSSFINQAR